MPPVTPRATFMGIKPAGLRSVSRAATPTSPRKLRCEGTRQTKLRVVPENLIERFSSLLSGAAKFRNFPLHLARSNFVLRDAARFAGVGLNHRRSSRLQLPSTPGGDQNVAIVAVEAFDQFHGLSLPPSRDARFLIAESYRASFFAGEAKNSFIYFPTKPKVAGVAIVYFDYEGLPEPGA